MQLRPPMALLAEEDVREVARQLYARHVLAKGDRPLAEADARHLLKVGAARAARRSLA